MPNLLCRAVMAVAAAAAGLMAASVPAAHAATTPARSAITNNVSGNWAGYFKATTAPIGEAQVTFTVPTVKCKDSRGPAPIINGKPLYAGAMWIGIGGQRNFGFLHSEPGYSWLEQDGIQVQCRGLGAKPVYQPFWEVVATPQFPDKHLSTTSTVFDKGKATVQPGDQIDAEVYTPAESPHRGSWLFEVSDQRDGVLVNQWTKYITLPKGTYSGKPGLLDSLNRETVEVITECPGTNKGQAGFVDLGPVNYTYADYFVTNTENGYSIASTPINLVHRSRVAVSPGKPYTPEGSDIAKDAFNTNYAKGWWKP